MRYENDPYRLDKQNIISKSSILERCGLNKQMPQKER